MQAVIVLMFRMVAGYEKLAAAANKDRPDGPPGTGPREQSR